MNKEVRMRGRHSPIQINLHSEQRAELEHWVRCTNKPAGQVRRAKVILLLADGRRFSEVQRQTGMRPPHARKWAKRFLQHGLHGLEDLPRPGRKPVFSPLRGGSSGEGRLRASRFRGAV